MKDFKFGKKLRLVQNSDFAAVMQLKCRCGNDLFVVYAAPNSLNFSRIGISIGKAAGSAVERNRLKRLVREAFRLCRDKLPQGFDYVVTAPNRITEGRAKTISFEQVCDSLTKHAVKAAGRFTK